MISQSFAEVSMSWRQARITEIETVIRKSLLYLEFEFECSWCMPERLVKKYINNWFYHRVSVWSPEVVSHIAKEAPGRIRVYTCYEESRFVPEKYLKVQVNSVDLENWYENAILLSDFSTLLIPRKKYYPYHRYKVKEVLSRNSKHICSHCRKILIKGTKKFIWFSFDGAIVAGFCSRSCSDIHDLLIKEQSGFFCGIH